MSYVILTNNQIIMTRGDTLSIFVKIMDGDEEYTPASGDVIRFALKRNRMNQSKTAFSDQVPLITKTIPSTTQQLTLTPNDTKKLEFGDQVYDIELTKASDGTVDTIIPYTLFTIAPEVH